MDYAMNQWRTENMEVCNVKVKLKRNNLTNQK